MVYKKDVNNRLGGDKQTEKYFNELLYEKFSRDNKSSWMKFEYDEFNKCGGRLENKN